MNTTLTSSGSSILRLFIVCLFGFALASCDDSADQNVEGLMKRAIEQRDQGKLRASVIDLKAVLQKDPKNAAARLMLGEIYLGIGDARTAEKELKVARELGANAADIHTMLGRARLLRGDYKGVLEDYQVDDNTNAGNRSRIELLRGIAYLARRELGSAEKSFQTAISSYKKDINEERPHLKATEPPDFVEAIVGITNVSIKRKNWDEAEERLGLAKQIAPNDPDVMAAAGELAFEKQQFAESETAFKAAFKAKSYDLQLQIGIGRAQVMLGKYDDAIRNFDAILEHFPDHIVTNFFRGLVALHVKDFESANNFSEKILRLAPNYLPAHLVSGTANYGLERYEQASINLRRYLASNPSNNLARRLLGLAQLKLSRPKEALATLKPLGSEKTEDTNILTLVAAAAAGSGDLNLASDLFKKSISLSSNTQNSRLLLAAVNLARGNHEQAERELEKAINEVPEFLKAKYALLLLYLRAQKFDKALDVAKELRDEDPDSPNPLIARGLAYIGQEAWDDALQAFRDVDTISPGHVGAAYGAADIHFRKNDIENVRAVYNKILTQNPNHLTTLIRLIAIETRLGRVQEANTLIERAYKAHPDALEPRLLFAQLQLSRNQPIKALATLGDVTSKYPDSTEGLQILGQAQLVAGKAGEAARTLERLVQREPASAQGHYLLAQAFSLLKNKDRMFSALQRALTLSPDFLVAEIAMIRMLAGDKKLDLARSQFETLKAKHPDDPNVHQLEGWLAIREQRPDEAVEAFGSISESQRNRDITLQMANALWQSGKQTEATETLSKWVSTHSNDFRTQMVLANYYLVLDKRREAGEVLKNVVTLAPKNWIALNNLADIIKDDDPQQALQYAERAHKLASNVPPVSITLAQMLLAVGGQDDRAISLMRSAVKRVPENFGAQLGLARALIKVQKGGESRQILEKLQNQELSGEQAQQVTDLLKQIGG